MQAEISIWARRIRVPHIVLRSRKGWPPSPENTWRSPGRAFAFIASNSASARRYIRHGAVLKHRQDVARQNRAVFDHGTRAVVRDPMLVDKVPRDVAYRRPRAVRQPRQRLLAQRVFTGLDLDLKRGGLSSPW
jgi:hypothetical protein